jgi:O-antigen/teichoic acid export membrane protein
MSKSIIFNNGAANAASILWVALIQVISVPVMASSWGVHGYGVWIMLTTIPTYVSLSDLGFSAVAMSQMTMLHAKNDRAGVIKTFRGIFALSVGMLFVGGVLALALYLLIGKSNYFAGYTEYSGVIAVVVFYSFLVVFSRIPLSALRATGNYAVATFIYDFSVFGESLVVVLVAWAKGDFFECAISMLCARFLIVLLQVYMVKKMVPWINFRVNASDVKIIKPLFKPAIGAMIIPGALAINVQGLVLIAGAVVSPVAAAMIGTIRTISRIVLQLVGIVNRATAPEFSKAFASGDLKYKSKIINININAAIFILLPGSILFAFFGGDVVIMWSRGQINPDGRVVALMALGMFLQGMWSFSANLFISINKHASIAKITLASSIVFCVFCVLLGSFYGLVGIACALVLSEAFVVVFMVKLFIKNKNA